MRANRKYWPCFIAAICGVIAITLSACSGKTPVIEHQVIFDANGGEWEEGTEIQLIIPDGAPLWDYRSDVPFRNGFTFTGWFSDKDCTVPYDPDSIVTSDTKLYAGWEEIPIPVYRVTFDSKGGTQVAPRLVTEGNTVEKPQQNPKRQGYTFAGWSTSASRNIPFDFTTPVSSDITLYAVWHRIRPTWTVSFAYDLPSSIDGKAVISPVPAAIKVTDGNTIANQTVSLSYNGTEFGFLGWFEENAEEPFDFTERITRSITLHAVWEDHAISSEGDYITYSADGLEKWAKDAPSASCTLIADIILTKPWTPIGSEEAPYTALFEGNCHSIEGLSINSDADHTGLFGYIGKEGIVRNLSIVGMSISGSDSSGGIAGENLGLIENCQVSGSISESGIAEGGIAGYNRGTIINSSSSCSSNGNGDVGVIAGINYGVIDSSSSTGSIKGEYAVGGITGLNNEGGRITDCTFTGEISDGYYAGGIAGCNDMGSSISHSSFSGTIKDMDWYIGGIAGLNSQESTITECTSSGTITGQDEAGGIVGYNFLASIHACSFSGILSSNTIAGGIAGISMGTMDACCSSGEISSNSIAGGIAGINRFDSMAACYFTGTVSSEEAAGCIAGQNERASISACFWQNESNLPGIGESISSTSEDLYAIGEEYTWEKAMDEMNKALAESSYMYQINEGSNTDSFPLIISAK